MAGRPRLHNSEAEKSRAYRERTRQVLTDMQALLDALAEACEVSGCAQLTNHLPHDPAEWVPELTARLRRHKLVVCRRVEKS